MSTTPLRAAPPNNSEPLACPPSTPEHPPTVDKDDDHILRTPPRPYYTPPLNNPLSPGTPEATEIPPIALPPAKSVSSTASPGKSDNFVLTDRVKAHRNFLERQVAARGRIAAHLKFIEYKETAAKKLGKQRIVLPIDFPIQRTIDSTAARRNRQRTRGFAKDFFQ